MGLCSPKFNQCVDELLQHVQNYASDEVHSGVSLSIEQDLFVQSRGSLEEKSFSQPDTELTKICTSPGLQVVRTCENVLVSKCKDRMEISVCG